MQSISFLIIQESLRLNYVLLILTFVVFPAVVILFVDFLNRLSLCSESSCN